MALNMNRLIGLFFGSQLPSTEYFRNAPRLCNAATREVRCVAIEYLGDATYPLLAQMVVEWQ